MDMLFSAFNPASDDLRIDPMLYHMERRMMGTAAVCYAPPPTTSGTTAGQTAQMQANNVIANNAALRQFVLNNSVEVKQNIFGGVITNPVAGNNTLNIPFRNVGLIKGFIVEVTATISEIADDDNSIVATEWNIANTLSNVTLYDLDNYQRINVAGWYLNMIGTAKEGFPHGAALLLAAFDTPIKYGNNYDVQSFVAPTSDAAGSLRIIYWVPCAYNAMDLRGALFSGVVNATGYLQLTINPVPWIADGSDGTLAVMTSSGATAVTPPTFSSVNVQVYQVYLDQLKQYPSGPQAGAPILPPLDISTQYRLNTTSLTGVSVGQDFPIPFSNFQQFLSLGIIYDQAGATFGGTDINYFALAAANTYLPFKLAPEIQAWLGRQKIKTDWPTGSYLFDFRGQPISTNQTGNMQLLLNAISAATGTKTLAGFEAFALVNTVLGAASLPAS